MYATYLYLCARACVNFEAVTDLGGVALRLPVKGIWNHKAHFHTRLANGVYILDLALM